MSYDIGLNHVFDELDRTYCLVPDCDEQPYPGDELCQTHQEEPTLSDGTPLYPRRKPTREERLQGLADGGRDTTDWEER
jgi:hypothetical protein